MRKLTAVLLLLLGPSTPSFAQWCIADTVVSVSVDQKSGVWTYVLSSGAVLSHTAVVCR
jgi:hypothetical protein